MLSDTGDHENMVSPRSKECKGSATAASLGRNVVLMLMNVAMLLNDLSSIRQV